MFKGIDFFSDTVTRPTKAMRMAMAEAEVGDEQEGEDPTTLKLEQRMAELLGHEASYFFPTATMANQVAIQIHCRPGEEILAAESAHVFWAEAGGPAVHARAMAKSIRTKTGIFSADDVNAAVNPVKSPHFPVSRLLVVENTCNLGGGLAWPLEKLDEVTSFARTKQMSLHLDGSRLFNAALAINQPAKRIAAAFDSVTVCFSKGLGCPMGAILAFPKKHKEQVRLLKQRMGGALRQSGIVSAAVLYALENHLDRLREDHDHAKLLGDELRKVGGPIRVEEAALTTNMVFFHANHPKIPTEIFLQACEKKGVRFLWMGDTRIRAVTHLDISRTDVLKAVDVVREVLQLEAHTR